jgi:Domain of unknown function (DUF4263)
VLLHCRINHARASIQLDEFKVWLDAHDEFIERDVVAELKSRLDLCLLIQLAVGRGPPDRYKHELAIQGVFRADFVVGCTTRQHFVLVEFEGGGRNSIFKRGTNQMRDWAPQLQHAFSQVSDWTWAKNDNQKSDLYRNAFGLQHFSETYLVVCGRSHFLDPVDISRLHWRSTKTMIAASPIHFWTYDDLYTQASAALDIWRDTQQNP